MRGSHAPSLRTIVKTTLREEIRLERGARILCACSGGPDSTAMLHVLAGLQETMHFEVVAHGVDHGLREAAASELALVAELARALGVPFGQTRVEVAEGSNLQARARKLRYDALFEAARERGAAWVATAHTADDRAETVLLRLLRGSGARGLAVLSPRQDPLLRPLIRASHATVLQHLERNRLPFARDPSNLDTRFARVRVRHEVLPLLRSLSPRIAETLNALADELAKVRDEDDPLARLGRRQRTQIQRGLVRHGEARVRVTDCEEVLVRATPSGAPEIPVVIEAKKRRRRA